MESKVIPAHQGDGKSISLLYLAIGFVAGALLVASGNLYLSRQPTPEAKIPSVQDVLVDYLYETSSGTATGRKSLQVESIEFHSGYVVIRRDHGSGELLASDRLQQFTFRPRPPSQHDDHGDSSHAQILGHTIDGQ